MAVAGVHHCCTIMCGAFICSSRSQVARSDAPEDVAGTFLWSGFDYLSESREPDTHKIQRVVPDENNNNVAQIAACMICWTLSCVRLSRVSCGPSPHRFRWMAADRQMPWGSAGRRWLRKGDQCLAAVVVVLTHSCRRRWQASPHSSQPAHDLDCRGMTHGQEGRRRRHRPKSNHA